MLISSICLGAKMRAHRDARAFCISKLDEKTSPVENDPLQVQWGDIMLSLDDYMEELAGIPGLITDDEDD